MDAFISSLPGIFDAIEASDEVRSAFIFAAWRRTAGEHVAERSAPLSVDEKRLVIAVVDKTWKRNLESLAPQLLFKLNAAIGRPLVDFIEFRIAPNEIEHGSATNEVRSQAGSSSIPPEVSVSARRIRNAELRETVLKAAANCLSRHE